MHPSESPDPIGEIATSDMPRRIHVVDLGSASGTRVDGKRIPVREWYEVPAGLELRCGKIAWRVDLGTSSPPIESPMPTEDGGPPIEVGAPPIELADESANDPASSGEIDVSINMVKGEVWQGDTVAAFLASQDEVDRKHRHEKIRATVKQKEAQANEFGLAHEVPSREVVVEPVATDELETVVSEPDRSGPRADSREKRAVEASERYSTTQAKKSFNFERFCPSWETAKLTLAVLLAIAVIALGIYQFIQFRSGPPVRVYEGIGLRSHERHLGCLGPLGGAVEVFTSWRHPRKALAGSLGCDDLEQFD